MKPLAVVLMLAALALTLAGCGDKAQSAGPLPTAVDTGSGDTVAAPPAPPPPSTGAESPPIGTSRYQVWLTSDDGTLDLTWQEGPKTTGVISAALELLLDSPDTAIPSGTRLLGVDLDDGVATVDLSKEFESGGGSTSMFLRLAQVVYTATQFDGVKSVRFHLDGTPVDVFSSEGIVIDKPLTRKDYEDLLPAIVVESPAADQTVKSPLVVSGISNVFEANVTIKLLDASGKELASTFTTATCGTGCWGTLEKSVPFSVARAQTGTLVVADDDADGDGKPAHEVRIPVRLVP